MFQVVGNPILKNAKWSTEDGQGTEGNQAIFPLCEMDASNRLHFIGTAFFICTNGIFVTAKHVVLDKRFEKSIEPLTAIHFTDDFYLRRPVQLLSTNKSDVAVGVLAPMRHNKTRQPLTNKILSLTTEVPAVGDIVTTFAYPRTFIQQRESIREIHFNTTWHSGFILEHLPQGRDSVMLPAPCCRTTMDIFHGASGGPVMNAKAKVFGVNSTGYDGVQESYVSTIQSIGGLEINDVMLPGESLARAVTTNELIDRGFIVVE